MSLPIIPQITYHLQVHEEGVFQYDIFVFNPETIRKNYDALKFHKKEVIVTEITDGGRCEKPISPEKLESLLALS